MTNHELYELTGAHTLDEFIDFLDKNIDSMREIADKATTFSKEYEKYTIKELIEEFNNLNNQNLPMISEVGCRCYAIYLLMQSCVSCVNKYHINTSFIKD